MELAGDDNEQQKGGTSRVGTNSVVGYKEEKKGGRKEELEREKERETTKQRSDRG